MMLECGPALFQTLYKNVIPYLLEYESVEQNSLYEETIAIPEWSTDKVPSQPEFDLQMSCRLQSTQAAMRYVAKCWGLSCAASTHLRTAPNVLLVGSLSHVLSALDQVATSSEKSLSCSLFCIQWFCSLVSAAYEMRLDAISTWPTVRTQAELLLLRLLHQVDILKGTEPTDARFSQYFLAAWLAYLPAGQFEQVFNFLASRTNN
ncbi:hypothetical protein PHYSODRAFT_487501 [Phytophthora sojae]|uniref:Uncharacterized protein n=1 Tax=Phytophthora sojae (strain P6497) TaxID=1094619 RepID=G4YWQ8_PHYSP|nr:hypothetical protein PHYSODRAFT_487501 [Phytophthora sojae]EGZ23778.1 hypothetical protein PHYSODRAFT_487501 [Phytophthora sojae]|eukprot:XP_009519066.1 hypothetical protein PHYSODRAFT_487501 [Phytophthora sojae]